MLHVIDHFPIDVAELEHTAFGDTVVLIENAIYAVKQGDEINKLFKQALKRLNCSVLGSDLLARGVETNEIVTGVSIIDELDYNAIADDCIAIRSWN